MGKYKKYTFIGRIIYVMFFFYLLVLVLSNIDLSETSYNISYLIVIPFFIYLITMVTVEILAWKEMKMEKRNKDKLQNEEYDKEKDPTFFNV